MLKKVLSYINNLTNQHRAVCQRQLSFLFTFQVRILHRLRCKCNCSCVLDGFGNKSSEFYYILSTEMLKFFGFVFCGHSVQSGARLASFTKQPNIIIIALDTSSAVCRVMTPMHSFIQAFVARCNAYLRTLQYNYLV